MPTTARRSLVVAVTAGLIAALAGADAFGGLPLGGTAPALHAPAGLGVSTPSVGVPSVPHISTPSLPAGSTPSVPALRYLPSLPSVSGAPAVPPAVAGTAGALTARAAGGAPGGLGSVAAGPAGDGGAGAATASGARGAAGAAGGSSAAGSGDGRGGGRHGAHGASSERNAVAAEYRGRAGERRLRQDIRRFAACLGTLPSLEHRMLALRGGIGTRALPRADAAERLHISRERAVAVEQDGIEDLKSAARVGGCAAESGPATLAARGDLIATQLAAVPQLQPTMLLAARPSLTAPVALARPRARALGGVEAASASGGSSTRTSGSTQLAGTQPSTADPAYLLILLLAALAVGAVALLRGRREGGREEAVAVTADAVAPEPDVVPLGAPPVVGEDEPEPAAEPHTNGASERSGSGEAGRAAAVATASIMSLAIAEAFRRRRR